jgi:flagellar biogenesis protein FliO
LAVIAGAVVLIKNTVKEINKVRRDEDGKWGAVVGEIIGNIIALLAIIAFATWLNSLIA